VTVLAAIGADAKDAEFCKSGKGAHIWTVGH